MSKQQVKVTANEIQFEDLTVSIRKIGEEYNSDMLAIMDRSPMQSKTIDFVTDRSPDIFQIPKFYYDTYSYFGFFVGEDLRGFALLAIKTALVNKEPEPVFHFTDYYLDHSLRRRNLYYLSGPYIYSHLPANCKIGYAIFIKGNLPIQSIAKTTATKIARVPHTQRVADLQVYSIFPMLKKRGNKKYQVRQATHDDINAMIDLLVHEHSGRLFGKQNSKAGFRDALEKTPGLSIEDYYVALLDDVVVGSLGVWDTSTFNRIKVTRYGWVFQVARWFHSVLAKLLGFQSLPRAGQHLQSIYLRDIAVRGRDPEILEALLVAVYNTYRTKDKHVIYAGIVKGDPLGLAFSHFLHEVVESQMVLGVFQPVELSDVQTDNPFVEFGVL